MKIFHRKKELAESSERLVDSMICKDDSARRSHAKLFENIQRNKFPNRIIRWLAIRRIRLKHIRCFIGKLADMVREDIRACYASLIPVSGNL